MKYNKYIVIEHIKVLNRDTDTGLTFVYQKFDEVTYFDNLKEAQYYVDTILAAYENYLAYKETDKDSRYFKELTVEIYAANKVENGYVKSK